MDRVRRILPRWLGGYPPDNIFWLTPSLAVGGEVMVLHPRRLQRLGSGAVLDLQAESEDRSSEHTASSLTYLKLPVGDFGAPSPEQLDIATAWVLDRMQRDERVFVHCRVGLGRSATDAIATLLCMGYELSDAYNTVRELRAEIALSEPQLTALRRSTEGPKSCCILDTWCDNLFMVS